MNWKRLTACATAIGSRFRGYYAYIDELRSILEENNIDYPEI